MAQEDDRNNETAVAEQATTDVEGKPIKVPYPKSVPFIISNEFCERFCFYGMRTVLVLYLTRQIGYDDDTATIVYHVWTILVYFMCVFGAILSDSWLGKFNTILYLSIVYAIGSTVVALGSISTWNMPSEALTLLGLALIALGSGGIKPCVAAFGGDQFKLPEQAKQVATFFSLFYFSINSGSFISTAITPILRQDVNCFEADSCYPLAFGVPGILMCVSILIFIAGKFLYKIVPPAGNVVVLVSKCISNAIATRWRESKYNKKEHWLEYAEPIYGKQLVLDTKILLNVLVLYIPLPVFWALYDQQGSRWTFQATRMDGDIGFYTVKPDQMQVVNPLLILLFIPLYDVLFYPLLNKIGIRRPLQKLTLGGVLAGVSFLLSGIVELQLEAAQPVLPSAGLNQFRMFNTLPCDYSVNTNIPDYANFTINSLESYQQTIPINGYESFRYTMAPLGIARSECPDFRGDFNLFENQAQSYYIRRGIVTEYKDNPAQARNGNPLLRVLANTRTGTQLKIDDFESDPERVRYEGTSDNITLHELVHSKFNVFIDGKHIDTIDLKLGAVATLMLVEDPNGTIRLSLVHVSLPNSVNMMWMLPQYIVLTLGEVMYSITGLSFSYSQAPVSMKSVLQACWLLTVAFGNVIDVIVVGAKAFELQSNEFFLFAGLMFIDMLIFAYLAYRYKPLATELLEEKALVDEEPLTKPTGIDNIAFTKEPAHLAITDKTE